MEDPYPTSPNDKDEVLAISIGKTGGMEELTNIHILIEKVDLFLKYLPPSRSRPSEIDFHAWTRSMAMDRDMVVAAARHEACLALVKV